ncbi:MAG: flagellar hook-associated protein FlgL, partial [Sulfurimicrobium sp.]|nr:flagellar hook-associated protein FlgL [Sulfurimicrobium sp.]
MRISTSMMYDLGVGSIQQQSAALTKTSQQVATGRRILTPADDPVAAARVLEVSQSKALNTQYDVNTDSATSALGMEETALASVGNLIQDVRTIAINAGNPTLDHNNLASLATDLRGRYQELLGIANSTDANGQYMFSGYQGATIPFAETSPGVVKYNGDQGQRLIQISPSRQLAVSDAGSDVFMQIKNG